MVRFELKTLLMHYKHSVEFIQGTPVKDSDLDRVSAKVASAFYLLADQQAKVKPLKLSQGIHVMTKVKYSPATWLECKLVISLLQSII